MVKCDMTYVGKTYPYVGMYAVKYRQGKPDWADGRAHNNDNRLDGERLLCRKDLLEW